MNGAWIVIYKLSVLIPVYNTEKYLMRCLDSVVSQTLKDIEIIITNDGSTDNSQVIIEEYCNKYSGIRYIIQENSGLGATRNSGINEAKGEYIAFLDSDDWVDKEYYEIMYNEAKKSLADVVISGHIVEQVEKNKRDMILIKDNLLEKKKYLEALISGEVQGFSWNKIYKRELIVKNKIKFPIRGEFENVEDQYFSIRSIFYSTNIAIQNESFVHYYVNKQSIVRKYQKTLMEDIIKLHNENLNLFKNDKRMYDKLIEKLCDSVIFIINNEFKPDRKINIIEKINKLKQIKEYKEYNEVIKNYNEYKYKLVDKLYFICLKYNLFIMLYVIAYLRCTIINIKN